MSNSNNYAMKQKWGHAAINYGGETHMLSRHWESISHEFRSGNQEAL